nr:hypothetical protein [Streptomyces benahoarensis]
MYISRERARSLFAELTLGTVIPLVADDLVDMPYARQHDHVLFGDVAVRRYKHKSVWKYVERDIRSASGQENPSRPMARSTSSAR